MKLFRLTKQFVPEYGRSEDATETFYISDDMEKVRCYINGKLGIELDSNGRYSHYYRYDEGSDNYTLDELEAVSLL